MSDFSRSYSNQDTSAKSIPSNLNKTTPVLQVGELNFDSLIVLLQKYQLSLQLLNNDQSICGSYWGDSEAGLINDILYVREDTPIHSLFHEMCHYICMDENRREKVDTNAEGDYDEENAVCYLQILLANELPEYSRERMMQDMDSWGYTFRLGSAKEWFINDAEDALKWLQDKGLLDENDKPNYMLRRH